MLDIPTVSKMILFQFLDRYENELKGFTIHVFIANDNSNNYDNNGYASCVHAFIHVCIYLYAACKHTYFYHA